MERTEAIEVIRENWPDASFTQLREALETLIPELKESEDERIRKFLVKHVSEWIGCIEHDLRVSPKDVESEKELAMFKAGLAYLEKQKDQRPAEWSEEDEKMLASFLHKVEVCDLLTNKENAWIVERFKSLRPQPHWKPSEEQMIYLKEAINKFDFCDAENAGLQALYEQLKKLH